MSDRITCPECGGSGTESIGTLTMRCRFCHGERTVGGNGPAEAGARYNARGWKIPEEGDEYDPDVHGPLPGADEHPAVQRSGLCPRCLGAGVVVSIGGMVKDYHGPVDAPCPECAGG